MEHSSAFSHECSGHTKFSFPHTQALLELEGFFHVYKRCVLSNLGIQNFQIEEFILLFEMKFSISQLPKPNLRNNRVNISSFRKCIGDIKSTSPRPKPLQRYFYTLVTISNRRIRIIFYLKICSKYKLPSISNRKWA